MRKTIAACLAMLFAATLVNAQANIWLDARDSITEVQSPTGQNGYANQPNGGQRGDGQTIYVSPNVFGAEIVGAYDASAESMTLYVDYNAGVDEVLSSVGIDFAIGAPAANQRQLSGTSVVIHNTPAAVGGGLTNNPWDGTAESTAFSVSGGGIKAVRVPVEDMGGSPVFAADLGITDGDGYRLATITVQGADCNQAGRGCVASLPVSMSVNNLLITQVSPGGSAPVALNLGYTGGAPEAATANGSTEGATSATADATVVIKPKGDFNNDGRFNNADFPLVGAAFNATLAGTITVQQAWTGDFNGNGVFNNGDFPGLGAAFNAGLACSACTP